MYPFLPGGPKYLSLYVSNSPTQEFHFAPHLAMGSESSAPAEIFGLMQ